MVAQSHPEGTPWNPDPTDGPQREAPGPPRLRTALPPVPTVQRRPRPARPYRRAPRGVFLQEQAAGASGSPGQRPHSLWGGLEQRPAVGADGNLSGRRVPRGLGAH